MSEKQREKMREKRQEQGHIPAMYSACDNSQSRSQYLADETQVRDLIDVSTSFWSAQMREPQLEFRTVSLIANMKF